MYPFKAPEAGAVSNHKRTETSCEETLSLIHVLPSRCCVGVVTKLVPSQISRFFKVFYASFCLGRYQFRSGGQLLWFESETRRHDESFYSTASYRGDVAMPLVLARLGGYWDAPSRRIAYFQNKRSIYQNKPHMTLIIYYIFPMFFSPIKMTKAYNFLNIH